MKRNSRSMFDIKTKQSSLQFFNTKYNSFFYTGGTKRGNVYLKGKVSTLKEKSFLLGQKRPTFCRNLLNHMKISIALKLPLYLTSLNDYQ